MKLRIDPDKISFRLSFEELELLLEQGEIQEKVSLPVGHFSYRVTSFSGRVAPQSFRRALPATACLWPGIPSKITKRHYPPSKALSVTLPQKVTDKSASPLRLT